jgi:F-type H+-transporting ATPase subunit epsilon
MENKLNLEIVTPFGMVFSDHVDEVVAQGSEGEFGVLPNHIPFFTTLKAGMLTYKKGGETGYFFVNWGYAEVGPDKVLILADSAERAEDISVERAMEAKKRAEERMRKAEHFDEARTTAAIERSVARVQIAERHQTK